MFKKKAMLFLLVITLKNFSSPHQINKNNDHNKTNNIKSEISLPEQRAAYLKKYFSNYFSNNSSMYFTKTDDPSKNLFNFVSNSLENVKKKIAEPSIVQAFTSCFKKRTNLIHGCSITISLAGKIYYIGDTFENPYKSPGVTIDHDGDITPVNVITLDLDNSYSVPAQNDIYEKYNNPSAYREKKNNQKSTHKKRSTKHKRQFVKSFEQQLQQEFDECQNAGIPDCVVIYDANNNIQYVGSESQVPDDLN